MLNIFIISFLCFLAPFQVYCLPDLDVRTITIDNEAMMQNEGRYSLDFSEAYPNLEEITIKSDFRFFESTFFNQFEDDLGLSNNKNLQSITAQDHFIKIIMKAHLPQLTSLDMSFYTFDDYYWFTSEEYWFEAYNNKKYKWDWISQLESLRTLKIYQSYQVALTSLLSNVSNSSNIEKFQMWWSGNTWLSKAQQKLVLSFTHLKTLTLSIHLDSFDYYKAVDPFNIFRAKFMEINPHVDASISLYRIPFAME